MAILLTKDTIVQYLEISKKKPLIIDVYADWCGPCKTFAPTFEEVSKELSNLYTFAKINIDEEADIAIEYGVRSVPTVLFIKDGSVVGTKIGTMNKATFRNEIEKAFK